jgi:putative ABC transport system permease protein
MKLIDVLLRLYPGEFSARYGPEVREFHQRRVRENASWVRMVWDHLVSAMAEQLQAARPDVRYAMRSMWRRPGFAVVVILTIALGVGANAAIFSVINGVLLRPFPYQDMDGVVVQRHEPPQWLVSEPQYASYRDGVKSFSSLAAYITGEANLERPDESERVVTAGVTLNFFATLGVQPLLGRTFLPDEDRVRPFQVVILSHDLWERRFNADSGVVGTRVMVGGTPRTVIGVMPEDFEYPSRRTGLWLPHCSQRSCASLTTLQPDAGDGWANHYLHLVGRLQPGITEEQARSEAGAIARQLALENPEHFDPRGPLVPAMRSLRTELVGTTRPYLYALMGAVSVVLLVVCSNVASLLLARGEARRREMSIRAALGASRRRLVTQLLTEAVVLAIAGGVAGLGLAVLGTRGILALAPPSLPRLDEIRVDWLVLTFGAMVSLVTGIVFGIVPALRASRADPADAMKSSGKGASGNRSSTRARRMLVVSEVALAMVLLCGAGMLVRSLLYLHQQDLGFDPAGALTANVSLNANTYDAPRTIAYHQQLVERARQVHGVAAVGAARWLPIAEAGGAWDIRVEGKEFPPAQTPAPTPQEVTPGWFAAMGIRILYGRDFTDQDRAGTQLVVAVNERFAREIWGEEGALGRRFRLGGRDSAWVTVVGVVADIRSRSHMDPPEIAMYFPHAQAGASSYVVSHNMSLVLRARPGVDPLTFATSVRLAARAVDPGAAVSNVMALESVVGMSTANRRFSTALIAGFAVLALVLAGIGIYGVISYAVNERTFEFGIRMALGADRGDVVRLVVGDGMKLALTGVTLGLVGSVVLARVIDSLLVGAPAIDVVTLGTVAAVLGTVAIAASVLPARRATAVNVTEALRTSM